MTNDEMWWGRIPGAVRLKRELQNALLSHEKGTWLVGAVPWEDMLRSRVKEHISEVDSRIHFSFYGAKELENQTPADLIFALNPAARDYYMPGKLLAEYIQEQKLLETHIIWLYGLDCDRHRKWLDFSSELARMGSKLRVVCQGEIDLTPGSNVQVIRTEECFSEFDAILFAMLLTSDSNVSVSPDLQMYYSYLAAGIAGMKIEWIPELLHQPEKLARNPEDYMHYLGISGLDVAKIVHYVQLKLLLPKLEERLELLVDELSEQLEVLLPYTDDFGSCIQDLNSLEIRHLRHFHSTNQLNLTYQQKKLLDQLYDQRNLIAHRKLVSGDAVFQLFKT